MQPRPARARAEARRSLTIEALKLLPLAIALLLAGMLSARADDGVTVAHAYSNFGTVKYPAGFAHLDYVNPDAPKGGEISIAAYGTFDSFNQYARDGVPAALNTITGESILTSTADDAYGMYCYLCTTMEYPKDLSWIIFNLRDDVHFSDGTPMTADDVAFSFNLVLTKGIAEYRNVVKGYIKSVDVLGPHKIKFTFTDQAPKRERVSFAGGTTVWSKAWFEKTGTAFDKATKEPFMGTGPYVLDKYSINERIIYKRDPNWWGANQPLNIGQDNFDTIRVEYFADPTAQFEGFKAGAYTFRNENSSKNWATAYDFPGVAKGWVKKEEVPDGTVGYAQSFVFNLDRKKFDDIRVREALGMMFNFEWSNQALFYGLYSRVDSFWPGSDLAASGPPSDAEKTLLQPLVDQGLLDASILTDPAVMPPVNDAKQNRPARSVYRAAGKLLDAAGWTVGNDGLRRNADGEVLSVTVLDDNPLFDRIINPMVENLQALGVDAKLDRVDTAQYVERRRSGDFDLITHGFSMGFEPGDGLNQWYGSKTADDSSRNMMRLRNKAVDALIPVVTSAKTLPELKTAVHAFDRVLRSLRFTIPQWYKNKHTIAYYDIYDHPKTMPPYDLGYLSFWWYDQAKADKLKAAGAQF
jgi:microcin C transport system substrate-binding protein